MTWTLTERVVHLMGTRISLQINHPQPEPILDEMVARLKDDEQRFSANDPNSELMQITKAAGVAPVAVDPELYRLIKIGYQESLDATSNLNIAIGPLVQTWRIGFADARVPTTREIKHALTLTDPHEIKLDDKQQTVFLQKPGMTIDLGALAKGYFADLLSEYLKEVGVESALIDLGGNIYAFGPMKQHDDQLWRIGIQNPQLPRGQFQAIVAVCNQSVVTSGIYERQLIVNGKSYHHILDKRTGYPIETELASLTIISRQSLDGELWTTRLFGRPLTEIMNTLNGLPDIEGIVIMKNGDCYQSEGLQ